MDNKVTKTLVRLPELIRGLRQVQQEVGTFAAIWIISWILAGGIGYVLGFVGITTQLLALCFKRQRWFPDVLSWIRIRFGVGTWWIFSIAFRIKTKIELVEPEKRIPRQVIVVSNHLSTIDIPMHLYLAWKLRLALLRFVSKISLRKAPIAGPLLRYCEDALVTRQKGGQNAEEIDGVGKLGERCMESGASSLIYPEGTRAVPDLIPEGDCVAPFFKGGLLSLLETMHDVPVLAIFTKWVGVPIGAGGSLLSFTQFYGKRAVIHVKLFEREGRSNRELCQLVRAWMNEVGKRYTA